jgi:hypothetical protein
MTRQTCLAPQPAAMLKQLRDEMAFDGSIILADLQAVLSPLHDSDDRHTRTCDGDLTSWNNGFGRNDDKIVVPQIHRHGRSRVTESERDSRIEASATGAANKFLRR